MTIEFRCGQCNQLLRVPDTSAGKTARCPKCQLRMQIPAASPANVPPPPTSQFAPPPPPPPAQSFAPPPPGYAPQSFAPPPPIPLPLAPNAPPGPFNFASGSRPRGGNLPPPPPPPTPPPPPAVPNNPFDFAAGSSSGSYPQLAQPRSSSASKKESRPGLPWEKPRNQNFAAFIESCKLLCFEPGNAFSQMKQRGSMGGPMMFSGLGYAIGFFALTIYYTLFLLLFSAATLKLGFIAFVVTGLAMGIAFVLFIVVPLCATVGNLMSAASLHLCLMICGGSKQSFDTTFRIVCYSQAAVMWVMIIPGGVFAAVIWNLVLVIIGIHKAHEVPMQRAVMTVLLPVIVSLVMMLLMGFFFCANFLVAFSRLH